ncbi:MinD-like ATPase involved in chromosome partitioning or flagellar assembly [Friedmanniella endophytica]|uniref:MinD-like ATPase involved in chromosome partitioning or flagellar assembly n=1 Tax=Microlunatus kandeliicorticis TaxID=1759536 RepID=A0A7W3IR13_9ACTN|nr:hypothetical protein [Microlunatus kandeliicorticis]MBA8793638.1 MinD-like ATPase involved in chromosome partitioning or flagellar assembly [Microlunatus kandeliicorticis]
MNRVLAGLAPVLLGGTAAARRLGTDDTRVRTPLTVSRRIAVVSVGGGTGCTTTVAALAGLLARRRRGPVLAVDAAGGQAGLLRRCGSEAPGEPDVEAEREAAAIRRTARTAADARQGLARSVSGLHLLDLTEAGRARVPGQVWGAQVGPVARFFDLVLTDWGTRDAEESATLAAESHLTVVVGRAAPASAAAAATRALELAGSGPGESVLVLLADVAGTGAPTAAGLRAELRTRLPARPERVGNPVAPDRDDDPVLVLPFDRALAGAEGLDSRRSSARTRAAHLAAAAAVVDRVAGRIVPPVRPPATSSATTLATTGAAAGAPVRARRGVVS